MIKSKRPFKILSTLSLAASDAREDTLKSVVLNTLFETSSMQRNELPKYIEYIYGFEPQETELDSIVNCFVEEKIIVNDGPEKIKLSDEEIVKVKKSELEAKTSQARRFVNFKAFLTNNLNLELENKKVDILYSSFVEYLYNSFYEFGVDAIKNFYPDKNDIPFNVDDILQSAYKKLIDKELCAIFKMVVDRFPDFIIQDDLDFLNEIALKTQSFASLGVPPDEANEIISLNLVDWVLYLDTNVLYSLLDLHSNRENAASKALIRLINDNKEYIHITLRYSDITLKELINKKDEFKYLDSTLSDSMIRALIKSDKLDDFSRHYYQNLLNNRATTIRPDRVIDLASTLLSAMNIEVSRTKARVDKLGEDFLNERTQDYLRYLNDREQNRMEYYLKNKIPYTAHFKNENLAKHDITLREIILDQRIANAKEHPHLTFNTVKYYAITLDNQLLQFDNYKRIGYTDERGFPIFFKPSFLLNKLVKILPVKTSDYKRAFFTAMTVRGFNRDIKQSEDIIKVANFLKQNGVDNEEIVYNLIAEDLFLEKFRKRESDSNFNEGQFIENEINRQYEAKQKELEIARQQLENTKNSEKEVSEENTKLLKKFEELQADFKLYQSANNTLHQNIEALKNKTQPIVIIFT